MCLDLAANALPLYTCHMHGLERMLPAGEARPGKFFSIALLACRWCPAARPLIPASSSQGCTRWDWRFLASKHHVVQQGLTLALLLQNTSHAGLGEGREKLLARMSEHEQQVMQMVGGPSPASRHHLCRCAVQSQG